MSSSISSTGSITSAGVGSGLDVEGIITKLMAIEQRPLTMLQSDATGIQTKISAYGGLQSTMSAFRDAALALGSSTGWSATTGTSADPSSVTVSTGTGAVVGSYALSVQNLATAQSTASGAYTSSLATVGAGTLHIDTGSWSTGQAAFTVVSGSTGVDVTVAATDTLADVRDKINGAAAGVTASIVTDASGARLVISASQTGSANGFRVTSADGGLAALTFDPPGGSGATTLTQSGTNANATINGLAVTSASNTLSGVIQGLTLNLVKATTAPVQIGVAQDASGTKTAITNFVTAYNNLAAMLANDVKYDSGSSTAGVLQGDSTAVTLQRQLRNLLGARSSASSAYPTLSQVGLEMQSDGTLKINDAKLTTAMANMPELKKLFAATDLSGGGNDGFAKRLSNFGDSVLGVGGLLTGRTDSLNASLKTNQKSQDDMNTRLAAIEARMRAQYTALDTQMSTLSTLSTYMTQQITNWNNIKITV
jgi:flagellar hook-associated protein 2